ncbi:MAG: hypothetical protein DRN71_01500 [Candidatus Nanohalarchaeota archaeon]|nr:MAG: hypothetical protein DRN71_01500 [Candidatus Nanohaloarchaeota archaeon]
MEIIEALKRVHKQKDVDEKLEGKRFCSALSFLDDWKTGSWELNFYDGSVHRIMSVSVGDEVRIKDEGSPFKPEGSQIHTIDISNLAVTANRALEIAKEYYEKNYKSFEVQRLFFALHGAKAPYWIVSVITKHLAIVAINIDAHNGNVSAKVHPFGIGKSKKAS